LTTAAAAAGSGKFTGPNPWTSLKRNRKDAARRPNGGALATNRPHQWLHPQLRKLPHASVREDGSLRRHRSAAACVEADVWARRLKKVMQKRKPPRQKWFFNLNNEATYDNGLICGGTVEIFRRTHSPATYRLRIRAAATVLHGHGQKSPASRPVSAQSASFDDREAFANLPALPHGPGSFSPATKQAFREKSNPNASTYLVIVTRGHKEDMARSLAWATRTEAPLPSA